VCLGVDEDGKALELNHFLESPAFIAWAVPRQFRVIAGSAAHSLHNEEVKEILEQRVCLFVGDGRFLAHTLPGDYLFIFDLACLVERIGRDRKCEDYAKTCRVLVDDLYLGWTEQGKPLRRDGRQVENTAKMLWNHIGRDISALDEGFPAQIGDRYFRESMTDLGLYFRTVLHEHDEQLVDLAAAFRQMNADHLERVRQMTDTIDERVQAVLERDRIIEGLRRRQWIHRLRDWVARRLQRA
jgi:hypothetical protein